MIKKLIAIIGIPLISLIVGFFIGKYYFKISFIVCEYNGSRRSYFVNYGRLKSADNFAGDVEETENEMPEFNLNGIYNNHDAIKQIEKQISEHGGRVITILE